MRIDLSLWLSWSTPWSRGADLFWGGRGNLRGSSCTHSRRSSSCWRASATPGTESHFPLHGCTSHISGVGIVGRKGKGSKWFSYSHAHVNVQVSMLHPFTALSPPSMIEQNSHLFPHCPPLKLPTILTSHVFAKYLSLQCRQ